MNYSAPDWDMVDNNRSFPDLLPKGNWISSQQKKSTGPDNELLELLWRNGQVVLHSQTNRKSPHPSNDLKPVSTKPEQPIKSGFWGFSTEDSRLTNQNPVQEDVTASWLHYPLDDSLGNEFCSDFFYEIPTSDPIGVENSSKEVAAGEKSMKIGSSEAAIRTQGPERRPQPVFKQCSNVHFAENVIVGSQSLMPPPKGQITDTNPQAPNRNPARIGNFSHFSRPRMTNKADLGSSCEPCGEYRSRNSIRVEVGESSMMTIGSSKCGSNQIENQANLNSFSTDGGNTQISAGVVAETARKMEFQCNRGEAIEPVITSSSSGSGGSAGRIGKHKSMNQSNKRKERDTDESECQSEEAEEESIEANKPAQRSASARRSRASEVHNLSERRRRDRINEKMKALQELIPHCNKSDKASMLDEAIEYLKSLQLQVQIMWMSGGMMPIMFPGVQHYMPHMGVGPGPLPSVNCPSQLPGFSLIDQSRAPAPASNQLPLCVPPALNPVNFQKTMRNSGFPESYANFLAFHHMQNSPQMVQQNQMATQPSGSSSSSRPCIGGILPDCVQSGKAG